MIPTYEEIILPFLKYLADGKEHDLSETHNALSEHFKLTDEGITIVEKLNVDKKGRLDKGLPDFFDLDLEEFRDLLQSLKA